MNKLTDWIRRHQVAAFFILTFAISWGLGFSASAVMVRGQYLLFPLVFVAACGPGLGGIIVAAISNTESRQGARKAFWLALLAAWFVSMLVYLANWRFIDHFPFSAAFLGLVAIAVVPVAFVIASAKSRNPSIKNYLTSLIQLRAVWVWFLLALVLIPALIVLSVLISSFLGIHAGGFFKVQGRGLALIGLILVKFLYQLFFFNATGEETGWRGFALPRLQARTSPLLAALVIAVFWPPWHLFLWQAEGRPVTTLEFWVQMYIGHALFSVLIVWICNRANGSILVAGTAHAAANTAFAFFAVENMLVLNLTWLVAALALIFADRMWKPLPRDHPAVYRSRPVTVQKLASPNPVGV